MIKKIYPREKYLKSIRPFYDSDIIKVITGIRRCGKSCILQAIFQELNSRGVSNDRLIFIPLDKRGFKSISTSQELESCIESYIKDDGFYYLFIDEVQNVKGFEKVVQAYAEEGFSVFLTGSNSYLLSDEISTKLTGRYLSFEVFPLDYEEYCSMKSFFGLPINNNQLEELKEFILNGGFPKSLEFTELSERQFYTRGIIKEIFDKDIRKRKRISNVTVFERLQTHLINNYSSPFSLKNIITEFKTAGISVKPDTIRNYISILTKSKILYECKRFDLKSKKSLCSEQKYYLADMSIFFSTNIDNRLNYGPSLENLVYLFLVSHGYAVSVGKIGKFECDFISRDQNQQYAYIQVTYSLHGGDNESTRKIKEREYRPFRSIKDGYPRYIISLDVLCDQQEGVHHINAIDLFLGKIKI